MSQQLLFCDQIPGRGSALSIYPEIMSTHVSSIPINEIGQINNVDLLLSKLKSKVFLKWTLAEQLQLKAIGAHQPKDFYMTVGNRSFSFRWFELHSWLTVSLYKKRLFCFPCLLFGHPDPVYCYTGFTDIAHFSRSATRHESSKCHIQNVESLNTLGFVEIDEETGMTITCVF